MADAPSVQPLDSRVPLLLLPVNIETRFVDGAQNKPELWVRIYPDQITIDTHEPGLTAEEAADGKNYWDFVWRAGNPPPSIESVKAPWRALAAKYGPQRAAWIASQTTPVNIAKQPAAPTPDGSAPVPPPAYPVPPARTGSWEKAAKAALLPDAWTVVTVSGGQTQSFHSGPVTAELPVGFTPGAGAFPPGSPVDVHLQWLVDFDAAANAGMALKIPISTTDRAQGFDRIFVYGVKSGTPDASADLSALLDAHHYSDGFSLIPQGAPTNNTPDAESGYSRRDVNFEFSFATERQASLIQKPAADGNVFANLIGVNPAGMAHIGYADGSNAQSATDMMTALWPSTLGYFLSQMMAGVFTPNQVDLARQYVITNSAPRGPIPAFRVGRTPYGVLPVTALQFYNTDSQKLTGADVIEPGLANFVRKLWPLWLSSSASAPHIQNGGDPDQELIGCLGMDGSSMAFRGRQVLGDVFLWNYLSLLGPPPATTTEWWAEHLKGGRQLLDGLGFNTWDPQVIHTSLSEASSPVPFPTVTSDPLSETRQLSADADVGGGVKLNYIQWLRQASVQDIQAQNYPGPKPNSLLYIILRQSVIFTYARLAYTSEIAAGRISLSQVREPEIVGIPAAGVHQAAPISMLEVLARPSTVNASLTWADFLVKLKPAPGSPFGSLNDLRDGLDRLAVLPTAELDRLLTETLDACSHRLDVWAGAIANAILRRGRANKVPGVHVGAFGWLEEVRPAAAPASVQGADLDRVRAIDGLRSQRIGSNPAAPTPLQAPAGNGGFVYTPSLAQAATAAVLRSGYTTHQGTPQQDAVTVDISSDRVRKALSLLSGIREGQSLSALLGYIFEDGLHAEGLDPFVQPFRDRFPVIANKLTPGSDPTESVAASNVVDGVALQTAFANNQFLKGQNWGAGLPGPGAAQDAVLGVVSAMDDYADALGDVSIAETVFQVVRGNFGRAGGLLDAISKGDRPPDPDVLATPRGGLDVTHRVAVLFAGKPPVSPPWAATAQNPRSAAEPALNAWLSHLLPAPNLVRCAVNFRRAGVNHNVPVQLSVLKLSPLDCLSLADASDVPQASEAEQRILFAAGLPPDAEGVQIDYTAAQGAIAFPDFFFLAKSLQVLIGASRPLQLQDLTVPEKTPEKLGGAVDVVDLRSRASIAVTGLKNAVTSLQHAIATGVVANIQSGLMTASFYGVPSSVPQSAQTVDARLTGQAQSVLDALQAKLTKAEGVNIATAAIADLLGLFSAVFGNLVVLPRMTPPDAANLHAAFAQSSSLVSSDTDAPARWFQQMTYVHAGVARLDSALSVARVLGSPAIDLTLAQLPLVLSDKWLALPIDVNHPPAKGRVALACVAAGNPATESSFCGLLVDEWLDRIPSTSEHAAVAFHYEEPKARAPQSLLLAVCPDSRPAWDDALIQATLEESLELAKIRTVDLDSVQEVGQILPALYFLLNLRGASISANFTTLKEIKFAPPPSIRQ
jgi:hypothetical protein